MSKVGLKSNIERMPKKNENTQLELDLPVEYKNRPDYKQAVADIEKYGKLRDMQPAHLVFNKNKKTFSAIYIFTEEYIKSTYPSLIIIKK